MMIVHADRPWPLNLLAVLLIGVSVTMPSERSQFPLWRDRRLEREVEAALDRDLSSASDEEIERRVALRIYERRQLGAYTDADLARVAIQELSRD